MDMILIKTTNTLKILSKLFLFSLIFLTPIPNFGTDIYTASLPTIVSNLNTNTSLAKMTIVVYLMAYGIGQLFFGTLSDIFGRRYLLLIGLLSFSLSSMMASFADTIGLLIAARLLQGLSVAIISVLSKSIITDKYRGERLQKASKYKVNTQVLSLIFSPLVGGYIQLALDWRWNFILLAIYGGVSLCLASAFIPETCKTKNKLSVKTIYSNLYHICSHYEFILLTANIAILYSIMGIFGVIGPFIIQDLLYNSISYGMAAVSCGICYLMGSMTSCRMPNNILFVTCLSLFLIASFILIFFGLFRLKSLVIFMLPIYLIMIACGLLLPRMMSYTLNLFRAQAGSASAVFGTFVMCGMGSILSITGLISSTNIILLGIFYLALGLTSILLISIKQLYKKI